MYLTDPQERALRMVGRMHCITAEQLRRRHYTTAKNENHAREILNELVELEGLWTPEAKLYRRPLHGGSLKKIYLLDTYGYEHLVAAEYLAKRRWKPDEQRAFKQYPHHTLAINDVLITAELARGEIELVRFVHERMIQRAKIPYRPDAYLEFQKQGRIGGFLLEVDMDTEIEGAWDDKIRRLVHFFNADEYTAWFPRRHGVIVVGLDERRRDLLEEWTRRSLARHRLPGNWEKVFTFTTLAHATDSDYFPRIIP